MVFKENALLLPLIFHFKGSMSSIMDYRGTIYSSNTVIHNKGLEFWLPIPQKRAPRISAQNMREQAFAQQATQEHRSRCKAMQMLGEEISLRVKQPRPLIELAGKFDRNSAGTPLSKFNSKNQKDQEDKGENGAHALLEDFDFQIEQSRYNDEHRQHGDAESNGSWLEDMDDDDEEEKRGQDHYCTTRSLGHRHFTPSLGRHCLCPEPHDHAPISPKNWSQTLVEADWNYSLPNGGHPLRVRKVGFADEVVTEVKEFDRWYEAEYIQSTKYWCQRR